MLKNPANHHKAVGYTLEQWTYAFTNTFTEERSRETYERYHVPASGRILWDSVLANLEPGHQGTWVDYKNDDRAPLLFISGDRRQPDAAEDPAVEREALQVRHGHRDRRSSRDRTCSRWPTAGKRSPTTP